MNSTGSINRDTQTVASIVEIIEIEGCWPITQPATWQEFVQGQVVAAGAARSSKDGVTVFPGEGVQLGECDYRSECATDQDFFYSIDSSWPGARDRSSFSRLSISDGNAPSASATRSGRIRPRPSVTVTCPTFGTFTDIFSTTKRWCS